MHTLLRQSLFWDSNLEELDLQKHKRKIIVRVLERGTLQDWQAIKEFYGKDTIRDEVLQARSLDKYVLAFCSAYFDVPKEDFRCYSLIQYQKKHWNY
jgi:hypothetical protein